MNQSIGSASLFSQIKLASFEQLSDSCLRINNRLCEHDVSFGIFIGELESFMSFRCCTASSLRLSYEAVLDFTLQGHKGRFFFNRSLLQLLFSEFDFPIDFDVMPRLLQEAAVLAVVERLEAAVGESIQGLDYTWDALSNGHSVEPYKLSMIFEIAAGQKTFQGLLTFEDTALHMLDDFFQQSDYWSTNHVYSNWQFPARLLGGYQTISYDEIESLAIHDILMLNTWGAHDLLEETLLWLSPTQLFLMKRVDEGWMVDRAIASSDEIMKSVGFLNMQYHEKIKGDHYDEKTKCNEKTKSDKQTKDDEEGIMRGESIDHIRGQSSDSTWEGYHQLSDAMKQLPVQLVFELGKTQFSLEELDRVAPGYVFDLGLTKNEPVTIYANGVVIGQCEIVEINGRLGARLTRIHR